ncbi:hypothetical protein D3C87_1760390 [compost metagenome]
MAGWHGQPVGVEFGAQTFQTSFIQRGIHRAITFDMFITRRRKLFQNVGKRLEIAGAVKLETEFCHYLLHRDVGAWDGVGG